MQTSAATLLIHAVRVAPGLLFVSGVQIHERSENPQGGWTDETLPGNGPRRGESHPFDGLLRKIHQLLNPPRPRGGGNGSAEAGAPKSGPWS
jgi:hypothetical protein